MSVVNCSFKDLAKTLDKQVQKDIKAIKTAAMRALNKAAQKSRTAVANQESKTLKYKSKSFKRAIKIKKATRENLESTISFPDNASEPVRDGKTYLMIPIKGGLKKNGYSKDSITKNMAQSLLKYSEANPKKTTGHTNDPKAFFKLKSSKTGQEMIAARNANDRSKMNWLFAGREGKNPDFMKTVKDTMDKNLEKDFERELKKEASK